MTCPGPLSRPEAVVSLDRSALHALRQTLVVAPHPDDESLGCGGLIAHLADLGRPPDVWVVTDGTRSHPNSRAFPRDRLRALREHEARHAVAVLGGRRPQFLRFGDCAIPRCGTEAFAHALARVVERLRQLAPDTVVVPWRRDPHCDHEHTWDLFRHAVRQLDRRPRLVEYPVWAWTRVGGAEAPRAAETNPWRLDITDVLDRKRAAVAAHASQTTALIDDDPEGFVLTPEHLRAIIRPYEIYLDARA